jgi:hypothetical protein
MEKLIFMKLLVGTEITKVIAGGSNGSIILLDLKDDSDNMFVLFIYCAWRITHAKQVIGTSTSDINNEKILSRIKSITNEHITDIDVNKFNDFSLHFSNDYRLDVFCDNAKKDIEYPVDNWTLCNIKENTCCTFNSEFKFTYESYNNNKSTKS